MNNYLNSSYITMYPSALRGGTDIKEGTTTTKQIYDPESRLTTEANITSLVNRLSIDGSFVISDNITSGIEISVHGYLFKITAEGLKTITDSANTDSPIYAVIRLKNLGQSGTAYTLKSLMSYGNDNTNLDVEQGDTGTVFNFQGVYFTQDKSVIDNTNTFGLDILEYSDSKWTIPHDSILRFNSNAIKITDGVALEDVIYKNANNKIEIKADEFAGHLTGNVDATTINSNEVVSHLTGNVKGDLTGNADTATNSEYAALIGTNTKHPQIGENNTAIYVDENGQVKAGMTIHYSTSAPTSDEGKDGDIWFQYA